MPDAQLEQQPWEPPSPLPPSTAEPTSRPNEHRLDIASLCNPMVEIPEIRQSQASSLFDKNIDAVHKPSSIQDCSCEQFSFFSLLSSTKCTITEFEVLLNGLTDDSIDRAITCFQEGLRSHKTLFDHLFDSQRAQIVCDSIL